MGIMASEMNAHKTIATASTSEFHLPAPRRGAGSGGVAHDLLALRVEPGAETIGDLWICAVASGLTWMLAEVSLRVIERPFLELGKSVSYRPPAAGDR